ncbi:carbon monoxide dehydrogenase subunit G [Nonomuraea sp. NPDC050536]|uniref:carbon monoxide dehydrogenase subunit G n=1 Tax=Nonomuraea sp. NPDC050536 TaxID=3364366 RepID=UPI0037C5489F
MKVAGSAVIGIDRERVWSALQDPAVLVRTIPGCERLEETGADTYRMTVNAGVASVKGVYQGEVALADQHQPDSFVLKARGQGAPGTVDATIQVRLAEEDGRTRVDYDADAVVGGMIGGVGQRMLGSVARRTADEFFAAVEQELLSGPANGALPDHARTGAEPGGVAQAVGGVMPAEQDGAAARGVYERPPKAQTQTKPWVMLAAFGMGAGIAITGVAVGWLLGRAARRS